jgi:hypothetical protein
LISAFIENSARAEDQHDQRANEIGERVSLHKLIRNAKDACNGFQIGCEIGHGHRDPTGIAVSREASPIINSRLPKHSTELER